MYKVSFIHLIPLYVGFSTILSENGAVCETQVYTRESCGNWEFIGIMCQNYSRYHCASTYPILFPFCKKSFDSLTTIIFNSIHFTRINFPFGRWYIWFNGDLKFLYFILFSQWKYILVRIIKGNIHILTNNINYIYINKMYSYSNFYFSCNFVYFYNFYIKIIGP